MLRTAGHNAEMTPETGRAEGECLLQQLSGVPLSLRAEGECKGGDQAVTKFAGSEPEFVDEDKPTSRYRSMVKESRCERYPGVLPCSRDRAVYDALCPGNY